MKSGRRWIDAQRIVRISLTSLATMLLTFSMASHADDAPTAGDAAPGVPAIDATPVPPAADSAAPYTSRRRASRHLSVAQRIDQNVQQLTRALELDAVQQDELRQILVEQHRRIIKLRSVTSAAPADATGQTLAIYEQSKARIRAMLNEEQRKKYLADFSHEDLAPAHADLAHWMGLQEAQRRQDQAAGGAK